MMGVEYIIPNNLGDLVGVHFQIYNPHHRRKSDWHYEYDGLVEAIDDGFSEVELINAIHNGWVRIINEVEE